MEGEDQDMEDDEDRKKKKEIDELNKKREQQLM